MVHIRPKIIKVFEKGYGRSSGGDTMVSFPFSFDVPDRITGYYDFPIVISGNENIYQCITISCEDDTAIHLVELLDVTTGSVFFRTNFVIGGIFDFPGEPLVAGETVRIQISNRAVTQLAFDGSLNWIERAV